MPSSSGSRRGTPGRVSLSPPDTRGPDVCRRAPSPPSRRSRSTAWPRGSTPAARSTGATPTVTWSVGGTGTRSGSSPWAGPRNTSRCAAAGRGRCRRASSATCCWGQRVVETMVVAQDLRPHRGGPGRRLHRAHRRLRARRERRASWTCTSPAASRARCGSSPSWTRSTRTRPRRSRSSRSRHRPCVQRPGAADDRLTPWTSSSPSSGPRRPASPTSGSPSRTPWAARWSTRTPCSCTAAWTSAPPSCARRARGRPAPPPRRPRRARGRVRRRLPGPCPRGPAGHRVAGRACGRGGWLGSLRACAARPHGVPRHGSRRPRAARGPGRGRGRPGAARGARRQGSRGRRRHRPAQRPTDRARARGHRDHRAPLLGEPAAARVRGPGGADRAGLRPRGPRRAHHRPGGPHVGARPGRGGRAPARARPGPDGVACGRLRRGADDARRRADGGRGAGGDRRGHPPARTQADGLVRPRPTRALARLPRPGRRRTRARARRGRRRRRAGDATDDPAPRRSLGS